MKLVIGGREYDAKAQPFIGDLRLLKQEFGFGWGEVARRLSSMDENADMFALLDDDGFLEALVAWIWMSRLRGGERDCTRADAEMVPLDDIVWRREPGDDAPEDEAIPTSARTVSVPGDAAPDAPSSASTKDSTKTSKKRSTAA